VEADLLPPQPVVVRVLERHRRSYPDFMEREASADDRVTERREGVGRDVGDRLQRVGPPRTAEGLARLERHQVAEPDAPEAGVPVEPAPPHRRTCHAREYSSRFEALRVKTERTSAVSATLRR